MYYDGMQEAIPGRKGRNCSMHTTEGRGNDGEKYIFRPYITRNGVTYWAKNYGLKAFRIPVDD